MYNTNTNNSDNNNVVLITFFVQAYPYNRLLSLLKKSGNVSILHLKKYENTKKLLTVFNACSTALLLGDYALLLCCRESRTRSQNSTTVPIFKICHYFCLCLLLCISQRFLIITQIAIALERLVDKLMSMFGLKIQCLFYCHFALSF